MLAWGVLGTADIAMRAFIPAVQGSRHGRVAAIGSRDGARAHRAAAALGIQRAHGSYEALLADPDVEVVYNPLPNHLHVPWTIRAAEAGKHVLCEKPIAVTAAEAETLLEVRERTGVRIQEAFMVRTHPQWLRVREMIQGGELGELRAIQGVFSYYNTDPADIRNMADIGGGGMLDIGCYPVTTSRLVTAAEPSRVFALIDRDPTTGIDRLGSALMDFPGVQASFTYSTQLIGSQRMTFMGTTGRLEVDIPFNAPSDRPCRLVLTRDGSPGAAGEMIEIPTSNQYTVMADAFVTAILAETPATPLDQPVPLEDSILNMRVLDALLRSAERGSWETP